MFKDLEKKDTVCAFRFENVAKDYEWLEKPTNCMFIDNLNNTYSYEHIFNSFLNGEGLRSIIGFPIPIEQYAQLLKEYTKIGKIMYFPETEIYKIVRSIVRKSIVILKVSAMCGMFKYLPYNFMKNTMLPYYSDFIGENVELQDSGYTIFYKTDIDKISKKYQVSKEDILSDVISLEKKIISQFPEVYWPKQKNLIRTLNPKVIINEIQQDFDFWAKIFTKRYCFQYPIIQSEIHNDNTISIKATSVLMASETGFMSYFLPIVSEQLGLSYIFYYLRQLKDDMSLEEFTVWINKMVNIYHHRNEINQYFIEGGTESLNKIEYELLS